MRKFTLRLGQFALSALCLTFLFRFALNLSISAENILLIKLSSIAYFAAMFACGWHIGKRECAEYDIFDIGFRFHLVTYLLCIGIGYTAYYIGWYTEPLSTMKYTAICWGIGLLIHFIIFLITGKKAIKGYLKEEIFE